MKKYFSFLICFALVSLVACDGGDPNDDGTGTGNPPEGTRLVEKIIQTYEGTEGQAGEMLFSYDAQNRVTKIEMTSDEMEEGEYFIVTISYGAGTVTAILKEGWLGGNDDVDPEGKEAVRAKGFFKDRRPAGTASKTRGESDVLIEEISTFNYTLNADGYLSTGTIERKVIHEESEVTTDSDAIVFTYSDGYLRKFVAVSENYEYESTTTYTTDYTWSPNNNLTKVVEKGDDGEYDWEREYVMTYGTAVNPTGVNIDMNALTCPAEFGDGLLSMFGFCGKSSKNLISAYDDEWSEGTVKWETDADGFVTKATQDGIRNHNEQETKNTYTIIYKK